MVSATRMTVSLKTDLRFPDTGHYGHGSRIIHQYDPNVKGDRERAVIRDIKHHRK